VKIALDECLNPSPSETIIKFLQLMTPPVHAEFIPDLVGRTGIKDHEIGEFLADDGGWYIISADRDKARKNRRKRQIDGPPLHKIMPKHGITGIYCTAKIAQSHGDAKARAIIATWPLIAEKFLKSPPGDRFLLSPTGGGLNSFQLRHWPPPAI